MWTAYKIARYKCPVIASFNNEGVARLIPCGKWSCKRCARLLARKWARRVRKHLHESNNEWWFITLTFGYGYRVPRSAFNVLPKLWDSLRKEMQRAYPDWQFMAFVEGQAKTRGGMPHFHIISNYHPPSKKGLKGQWTQKGEHDWAVKRGFGFQVQCKPVRDQQAGDYVAKYASKGDPAMPKKFRRVRVSRDWTKLPVDPNRKLLVPARGETLIHFIMRVNEITGEDMDTLANRWSEAQNELRRANERHKD